MPMVDDDLVDEALDVYDEAYFVLNGFDDAQPDPIDDEDDVPLLDNIEAPEIEDPGNAAAFVPLIDDVILDDEVVVPNRILNHDDIDGPVNAIDNDDLDSIAELDIIPEPDINIPDEPTHGYNLRSDRAPSYQHLFGHQFFQQALQTNAFKSKTIQKYITGFMLTQMTATAGIKKHGQRAIEAPMNEFLQLHNKDVFEPMHAHKLTNDQKRRALRAINLIKEKRCGKLKGRTVADGSMQRNRYTKEETTSPTILGRHFNVNSFGRRQGKTRRRYS